ncbi:outer membrane immunogenic protein [Roseovarius sp. MBR-154]|jgi:opacity protein-like surface antigen
MLKTISALATATALVTAPAFAGNVSEPAPEPVINRPAPVPAAPTSPNWTGFYGGGQLGYGSVDTSTSGSDEDIIGGFTGGYDYDFGQWVVGGGLDYDFADIDAGANNALEEVFRAKARAGYKIGQGLLYGTGGYALASTETAGTDDGWFVGGGYEHMITEQFSVGAEALYHEFDSFNNSGTDIDATTVQARALFRF